MAGPRFALIAGEVSGDLLGAGLITELRKRYPDAEFFGVAGPRMRAVGCESLADIEALSLFGAFEIIRHLPRLFRLRAFLYQTIVARKPTLFIGIDAPAFNLGMEIRLRQAGLRTVHYVSPTVWAWRPGRIEIIRKAADRVLTLFPFEKAFYDQHQFPASYVGHPLADEVPLEQDQAAARAALGLPASGEIVALLPGSRGSEVLALADAFLETARWVLERRPGVQFIAPMANAKVERLFRAALARHPQLPVQVVQGQSHVVLTACDATLLASGTAALEALLHKRPMAVAYRISGLTYWLVRLLLPLRVKHVSLPNHLTPEPLVPEFLQAAVQPQVMGAAMLELLANPGVRTRQINAFAEVHRQLRCGASEQAANAIAEMLK